MMFQNLNESRRQAWLRGELGAIPAGAKLLDAGAGELKNLIHCKHLNYVSQDFCQYEGVQASGFEKGLGKSTWDTSRIDIISDITTIPLEDASFDAVLCSEVLEHVPDPTLALDEFARLLRPGGKLILTAPFSSNVHQAPFHFCTGFSKYWYEHHLPIRGFDITSLEPNGDWFELLRQELWRVGSIERKKNNRSWPLAYALSLIGMAYFALRGRIKATDIACLGWHCVATKGLSPG